MTGRWRLCLTRNVSRMSRTLKCAVIVGASLVASLIYALVRPEPRGFPPLKGTVASPADPKLLAGHYYEGDGTAHRELDLNPNMTYTMELWGCFGSDARSTGTWSLTNSKVVFAPAEQTGVLARPRKELSVLLFRNHWVLLSDEEHYQKFGVSRFSCFQNTNFIYWGP